MDDEEREHYTKLSIFTCGISLDVLHLYFEIKILDKEEFFHFLDRCKHELFHARHPAVSCCECRNEPITFPRKPQRLYTEQFNLLFTSENSTLQSHHNETIQHCPCKYSASRSVEVGNLDISLVYVLVKLCCPSIHGNPQWIKDVKDTRNFLAHKSNCRLTKDEYDTWLAFVENATLDLAKVVCSKLCKITQKQISDFKKDKLSPNTVKEILASSNDYVCKRLESLMRNLVTHESILMSRDIIEHMKKCKDELSVDINKLVFVIKTHICEQLPSQKITEESIETRCATSSPQTTQPQSTQSKNENRYRVEWKLAIPDKWNVSEIKNTIQNVSCLLKQLFEIEFIYIGSLVIRTIVPEHILSNNDDFKSAVRSFLAKIVEVCQLDTDTHTVVKVDLNIFTEIPPKSIETGCATSTPQTAQPQSTQSKNENTKTQLMHLDQEQQDTEEYISERDWGHTLFSQQYCVQLIVKVVKIDGVVQKCIDSETISEAERKSLLDTKVADQKFRHLLTIITEHCNRNDLQAFKTFIDILGKTNNVDMAQQLSLIYNERVNYVATLSRLSKEKSLVRNSKNEISRFESILEEKERYLESLTDEKNKLVDHYRKVADNEDETFTEEKLSLEKKIKKKEEYLLFVEKERRELTRTKKDLENEVNLKSNVIRKREKEIAEKEREVREAIEESNRLRLKIDTLQQQQSKAVMEDKEMSKKIEILKEETAEKEKTIMNLRKNKTMTQEEIEEELGYITKGQEKKLDDQTAMIKQQNEKIDEQAAMIKQQSEKMDTIMRALSLPENR